MKSYMTTSITFSFPHNLSSTSSI